MFSPPKVTHVVLSLDCGGLERVALDLVNQGRQLGQEVNVLCLERPGTLAPQLAELGVGLVCLHKRPGLKLNLFKKLRQLFHQLGPHVVHTHQVGALFYAGPAAHAARIPLVVHTEHGKHYAARRRTRWLGWLGGRSASRFFCVSQDIAREVATHRVVPPGKLCVVPNAIDTVRFAEGADEVRLLAGLGIPSGAKVVGTLGRLNEVKRQDLLLRAFARLAPRVPAAHLVLVGDGPQRAALRELAAALGLGERIHFAGYQSQPERWLRVLDVFALTSRSEGLPLAILEAWAAGVPVVASRVGGIPELVEEGRTGLLFPSGDEAALAAALETFLTDAARAHRMSEAGRQLVRARYDVRVMAETYHRHYLELLSRKWKPCRERADAPTVSATCGSLNA